MMLRGKFNHQLSQHYMSCDQFILSCDMTFMSRWKLHHTLAVNQVDAFMSRWKLHHTMAVNQVDASMSCWKLHHTMAVNQVYMYRCILV